MLKSLRTTTANAKSSEDFWLAVLDTFDLNTSDTPFGATYEIKENNDNEAVLMGSRGIPNGHAIAPRILIMAEYTGVFGDAIRDARRSKRTVQKHNLLENEAMFGVARRGFKLPCKSAVVIPIPSSRHPERIEAFIILGINPKRSLDSDYQVWIDQIQSNIALELLQSGSDCAWRSVYIYLPAVLSWPLLPLSLLCEWLQ